MKKFFYLFMLVALVFVGTQVIFRSSNTDLLLTSAEKSLLRDAPKDEQSDSSWFAGVGETVKLWEARRRVQSQLNGLERRLEENVTKAATPRELGDALSALGVHSYWLGNLGKAEESFSRESEVRMKAGQDAERAISLTRLGWTKFRLGRPADAVAPLRQAIGMYGQGNPIGLAYAHRGRGFALMAQGDAAAGESDMRVYLSLAEKTTEVSLGMARAELGDCLERQGRRDEAKLLYKSAISAFDDEIRTTPAEGIPGAMSKLFGEYRTACQKRLQGEAVAFPAPL